MNKTVIYLLLVLMLSVNLFLSYLLLRQNKESKLMEMSIGTLGNTSLENSYLKSVIGEFYLREGKSRSDINGLRDGKTEQKLSEILQEKPGEYSLILEAGIGDCSRCVDSVLYLLGKTTLKNNLIFISTFKNYGSLQYIKTENGLQNAVFFNAIIERRYEGDSPKLYLIDRQMKTTKHCLVDYRNMSLVAAYLRTIEKELSGKD